jgi:large conductance mechanosensitive channel
MLKGFRDFIMRGNVIDLAVAFVIGGAFAAVVTSFVGDILTPLLGLLGVPDFSTLVYTTPGGAEIRYGAFLNALISFVLIAAAVYFILVAPIQRRRAAETGAAPTTKTCPFCASEIPLAATRCPLCTSQLGETR